MFGHLNLLLGRFGTFCGILETSQLVEKLQMVGRKKIRLPSKPHSTLAVRNVFVTVLRRMYGNMVEEKPVLSLQSSKGSRIETGREGNTAMLADRKATGAVQTAQMRSTLPTRLYGRRLLLSRITWSLLVVFALGMTVLGLPGYFTQLQTLCHGAACGSVQLSAEGMLTLKQLGFSLGQYTAFTFTLTLIPAVVCCGVAVLLVLRRSDDAMALLISFVLVSFASGNVNNTILLSQWVGPAFASILANIIGDISLSSFVLTFYLFPDVRFVPRWTRWLMLLFIGVALLVTFGPLTSLPLLLITVTADIAFFGALLSSVLAQLYRYRRVSSPLQRQQTKWIVYSLTVTILLVVATNFPPAIVPALSPPGSLFASINNMLGNLVTVLIPLSFVVAILHYRLWDIDLLINRTLVYGTLTAILALVYVGSIVLLQDLLRGIIHQDNAVAIVVSTLIIAALFQPLRRRIQALIDRRFYRRKYDAAKTLEAFSATLRNEVDLSQLSEHLITVVQETMQPSHVSLWLRPPEHDGKQRAPWRSTPPASSDGK